MQIDLLGTSFSIQTDEDPEYVGSLIQFLEERVIETSRSVQTDDPLKIAIISALMIADELFQSGQSISQKKGAAFNDIAQDLIRQIDLRLTPPES